MKSICHYHFYHTSERKESDKSERRAKKERGLVGKNRNEVIKRITMGKSILSSNDLG